MHVSHYQLLLKSNYFKACGNENINVAESLCSLPPSLSSWLRHCSILPTKLNIFIFHIAIQATNCLKYGEKAVENFYLKSNTATAAPHSVQFLILKTINYILGNFLAINLSRVFFSCRLRQPGKQVLAQVVIFLQKLFLVHSVNRPG